MWLSGLICSWCNLLDNENYLGVAGNEPSVGYNLQ